MTENTEGSLLVPIALVKMIIGMQVVVTSSESILPCL
jgi:hypothetical protein